MNGLMIHAGGKSATMDEIKAVNVPAATETWFPVAHDRVIEMTTSAIANAGYRVEKEHFGLSNGGSRLFGTFDLQSEIVGGVGLSVGIRSSLDQKFAIGFCAGSRVFVCDNLAFSAERVVARKHTRFGADRYYNAICESVQSLTQFQATEAAWINNMDAQQIGDKDASDIILRAYESNVIGVQSIPAVLNEWRRPSLSSQENRTAWGLFNAFTYVLKSQRTHEIARRTMNLRGVFATTQAI